MCTRPSTLQNRVRVAAIALLCWWASAHAGALERAPNRQLPDRSTTARSVDVRVDAQTRRVTLRMGATGEVADGGSLPTLHPEQLQVFEDSVRQPDVRVDIEHVPVTLSVLIEMGGRSRELTRVLEEDAPYLIRPLFGRLGPADNLTLLTYDRTVHTAIESSAPRTAWNAALDRLKAPMFSEANFYDATIDVLNRMKSAAGRRAIVIITTGIDTFSRTTFDDLVARVREAQIPIYCLSLAEVVQSRTLNPKTGPLSRVNWHLVDDRCARLSAVSGGRLYRDVGTLTTPAIFDVLERLRVQYVLSYVSPAPAQHGDSHTVEIRVADSGFDRKNGARTVTKGQATERVVAEVRYSISADGPRRPS
jgi:hypothetical protein